MSWKSIFKPAPPQEILQDPAQVSVLYKYWRWRIFIGMYVGYIFYYFTRKSYTFIMPLLLNDRGFSKSELGILASIMALTYGASKFLSGVLADRSNPRFFMALGLILTGVFNILFGASSTIMWFAIFWGLNGWFQGWGWPPCAKLLTHWYSQNERGTWWGLWNSSHNVGGAIIPLLVGLCAQLWGWRWGMIAPGLVGIGVGLFLLYCLRDTPRSLGLPDIETFRGDVIPKNIQEETPSVKELLFKYVLNNGYIWLLAIAYFFVYLIRGAINDWAALYLMETRGYSLVLASGSIVWFEVGGLVGSLAAGWFSDKIFKGKRGPVNVLFSIGALFALLGLWILPWNSLVTDYLLIFVSGFFIFGPQMLIGIAAAELSHKKAAGSATGFIGWVAYVGMAFAGYPLGKVMEVSGWEGCFITLLGAAVISIVFLIPLWKVKYHPKQLVEKDPQVIS